MVTPNIKNKVKPSNHRPTNGKSAICYHGAMLTDAFSYHLPAELIAEKPLPSREHSRLLHLRPDGGVQDMQFIDFPGLLRPHDAVVVNNTKVMPARLHLHKASGGKVELLLERILDDGTAIMQLRASRRPKPSSELLLHGEAVLRIVEYQDEFAVVRATTDTDIRQLLHQHGQVPLPPYIPRAPDHNDQIRYQTIFAEHEGSVAAPTAGLHFSAGIMEQCGQAGAQVIPITMHIGAGTFQPVRSNEVEQHKLHQEHFVITDEAKQRMQQAKLDGGRIIAVGTSVVRALESATSDDQRQGSTSLFIYPGYKFKAVDAMLTNFHLPRSSLLMLVCAFAGMKATMDAYQHAIENKYRFYSYGDAMFMPSCSQ